MAVFYLMKNYLSRIGAERLTANKNRFAVVSEAFGATKEVKILGIENFFVKNFDAPAKLYANNLSLLKIIIQFPRFIIEAIAFGGMILLVLFLIKQGKNFSNIAPLLALYAFAGYRLMPALQHLYGAFSQIRFSDPAL